MTVIRPMTVTLSLLLSVQRYERLYSSSESNVINSDSETRSIRRLVITFHK